MNVCQAKNLTEMKESFRGAEDEREDTAMKKILSIVMVLMMAVGLMIPVFASAAGIESGEYAWVNCADGKTLNVRTEPRKSSKALYRAECGTKLFVIEKVNGEWARVSRDGKPTGYVMTKFLVASKPGKYEITERDDNFRSVNPYRVTAVARGKNTDESVGLRVKPNKTAGAIRRLTAGDTLEVLAVGKTWSQVKDVKTGRTGYVANDYIARV